MILWVPVNGGIAKECPLLWSIHHWNRLRGRGLDVNVIEGIVEHKATGTACVLQKFRNTLLTFPVTGARCTRRTKDGVERIKKKVTFHGDVVNFFCGISMDGLRSEGAGTGRVPWKADFSEGMKNPSPWGASLMMITNKKHEHYGRFVRVVITDHLLKKPIDGKWRVQCCDVTDQGQMGRSRCTRKERTLRNWSSFQEMNCQQCFSTMVNISG